MTSPSASGPFAVRPLLRRSGSIPEALLFTSGIALRQNPCELGGKSPKALNSRQPQRKGFTARAGNAHRQLRQRKQANFKRKSGNIARDSLENSLMKGARDAHGEYFEKVGGGNSLNIRNADAKDFWSEGILDFQDEATVGLGSEYTLDLRNEATQNFRSQDTPDFRDAVTLDFRSKYSPVFRGIDSLVFSIEKAQDLAIEDILDFQDEATPGFRSESTLVLLDINTQDFRREDALAPRSQDPQDFWSEDAPEIRGEEAADILQCQRSDYRCSPIATVPQQFHTAICAQENPEEGRGEHLETHSDSAMNSSQITFSQITFSQITLRCAKPKKAARRKQLKQQACPVGMIRSDTPLRASICF